MLYASAPLGLNGLEIICIGVVLIGVGLTGRKLGWTRRETLVALVLITPVLVLTAAEATQFMTMDEWGISRAFIQPGDRGRSQIMYGWFFTGGALVELPLVRLMELGHLEKTAMLMLLKVAWWLWGNVIISAIAFAILRLRQAKVRAIDPFLFVIAFSVIALMPTTQLAIKTVNYDLFSFGLGTLALLIFVRRWVSRDKQLGRIALVLAILAAQEKLTAGPVLVLIIVVEAVMRAAGATEIRGRVLAALRSAVSGVFLALAIPAASLSIYRLLGPPTVPDDFWAMIVAPLASWGQIPLGFFIPLKELLTSRRWLMLGIAVPIAILISVALFAALLPFIQRVSSRWVAPSTRVSLAMLAILIAGVYAIGAISANTITAFWDPYHPAVLRHVLGQRFSGVILHTGATTLGWHLFEIVAYALAVLVVAIPSGVWALAGLSLARSLVVHGDAPRPELPIALLLIGAGLVQPVASALAGMPFAHRYFDLSLTLLVAGLLLAGLTLFGPTVAAVKLRWRLAVTLALVAFLIAETAPFRPLFAAFRPFWMNYADATRAEPGRLNASWMGWGEDIMAAGKMIEQACLSGNSDFAATPCSSVTLYALDSGLWLPGPRALRFITIDNVGKDPPFDARSYYVVNRLYLIQKIYPIPSVVADFTVQYRGYAIAWVFRGDHLAQAGYRLH